ncbi:MAG: FixH family protein [Akkermansiaceae bacterium]|nr:FixH family protein [Verrucomicrobiales bacterium]
MNSKRNLWPFGILLTFALFISGTIALIVIACNNDPDLVSHNYYEEEMQFQQQIDRLDRAHGLEAPAQVSYNAARRQIVVTLPPGHTQKETSGSIQLYRPSASGLDQNVELKPDANGIQSLDARHLLPGLWKVRVFWTAHGTEYRADQKVVIGEKKS